MKRRARLIRRADFQRVLAGRRLLAGRTVVAFGTADRRPGAAAGRIRVGVAAARRIQGAVRRNRAKRRVREAVRVSFPAGLGARETGIAYDVVVIARPAALVVPMEQITVELRTAWERLTR